MTPEQAVLEGLRGNRDPEVRDTALAGCLVWFEHLLPLVVRRGTGEPVWVCPHQPDTDRGANWRIALAHLRACHRLWPAGVRAALLGYRGVVYTRGDTTGLHWEAGGWDLDGFATLLAAVMPPDPLGPPEFDA